MRKHTAIFVTTIVCLLIIIYAVVLAPRTIDWQYSFSLRHKKPLGCKILREQLHHVFTGCTIYDSYNKFIDGNKEYSGDSIYNLIMIDQELNLTNDECKWLIAQAEKGNHIMLAVERLPKLLGDTLKLAIVKDSTFHYPSRPKTRFNLQQEKDTILSYEFSQNITNYHLRGDSLIVLSANEKKQPTFIRKDVGKGAFYIHCNPLVFSNYHLLTNHNYTYAFGCLAKLPMANTYWDEQYKSVNRSTVSPIAYIHSHSQLKQAWYLLWFIMLLYFILESRRRQRAIPTLKKSVNTTLEFIHTMGRLYLSRRQHHDIAIKRYSYFKDFVKRKYHLTISQADSPMVTALSEKSCLPSRSVSQILETGEALNNIRTLSEAELIRFNRTIEFFYHNCK